jgi:glucose-6-phosphate 1-dehydrogenase
MEPPVTGADRDLHRAKTELLASVRVLGAEEVPTRTGRARYTAGRLATSDAAGGDVRGYARADGVDPARLTETYAEVVLEIDTPRWAGTRFVLRTGKAMAVDRKGVALHFRGPAPTPPPGAEADSGTTLWFELDGPRRSDRDPTLSVHAPGELAAYRQVLLDVLGGGSRTSVSAQEAELAWRIVEPVLRAWTDGAVPMLEYPAGSAGPPRLGEGAAPR